VVESNSLLGLYAKGDPLVEGVGLVERLAAVFVLEGELVYDVLRAHVVLFFEDWISAMGIGADAVVDLADSIVAVGAIALSLLNSVVYLVHASHFYLGPPHQHYSDETGRDTLHESGEYPVNIVPIAVGLEIRYMALKLLIIIFLLK
jgi:hypothetical protein